MDNFKKLALTLFGAGHLTVASSQEIKAPKTEKAPGNLPSISQIHEPSDSLASPEKITPFEDSLVPEIDVFEIYNKNKEAHDEQFNIVFFLSGLPDGIEVAGECKGTPNHPSAKVFHYGPEPERALISKEKFANLSDLGAKYPQYKSLIEKEALHEYDKHVFTVVWSDILAEKEKTLSNDFEGYVPSQAELDIVKADVAAKKAGGTTDGYDAIYHYYVDQFKDLTDRYRFYQTHNGKPEALALHMRERYYLPFIGQEK